MEHAAFQVRRAQPSDLPGASVLAGVMVRMHHAWDPQRFAILSEPIESGYADWLAHESRDDRALVLVAVTKSAAPEVVGYAYARLEGRDWWRLRDACGVLHDLVVEQAWRGRGVGTALLGGVAAWLREKGSPRMVIETAAANAPAQAFFQKHGFRPTLIEMATEL